ncbi:acid phosphatase phoa [Niveomyces insectorum RCEF 264]|uniref:Acid phosphatase phoa n=1 Tax=Niveomyces insectorum RCEF 264 TaxID=1081102 RepID=A0A167QDI0_9HYPO|nr:acid phosphatase phoa [Niveomyces insectorum RCEF 264]
MRSSLSLLLATAAATVSAQTQFTATSAQDVYAAQATARTRSPVSHVRGRAFDRIAIIWLENTDYTLAAGDPNLAFLASKGIKLSNNFAVTHPSEPNYAASHGGDYFGMDNDNFNFVDKNITTIVDLLEDAGISWGEYQEDMPYSGFEGFSWVNQQNGKNDYVRKHNPAVLYNSNTQHLDRLQQMKNLTMFYDDLKRGTLPQWMFITPNMTSDGHDSSVTVAGAWTRNFVEPLLTDRRFMQNTLVLITFDENGSYGEQNRILGILLGDAVPQHLVGTTDAHFYNHYSTIATVEANWNLPTLGRWDVGANVYQLVAQRTGDLLREFNPRNLAKHFYNESYDGVFNSAPHYAVYPKPNLALIRNWRFVSLRVIATWIWSSKPTYYTDTIEVNDGLNPPAHYNFKK